MQLIEIAAGVGEVGQPVQGAFVALVGQGTKGVSVSGRAHVHMLQRCPWGKVKRSSKLDDVRVITIGQVARYVGVTTKTIRVYHHKGLLPEPERDASGYRRYTAHDVVELIKVRTLAEAGLPLADIREMTAEDPSDLAAHIQRVDRDLTARIRRLRLTQRRLRQLATGTLRLLPADVTTHLEELSDLGLSRRWVQLETDLWVLVFATHPQTAADLFRDQTQALTDPALRQLYLDYDQAHDLDPNDSRIDDLARRIVEASTARYQANGPPGQYIDSDVPALAQDAVNVLSPAWRRLDHLIRSQLRL